MRKPCQLILLGVVVVSMIHIINMTSSWTNPDLSPLEFTLLFQNHHTKTVQSSRNWNTNLWNNGTRTMGGNQSKYRMDEFDAGLSHGITDVEHTSKKQPERTALSVSMPAETAPPGGINASNIAHTEPCASDTFLAIFVSSAVANFRHREVIRHTWASRPPDGVRVFFVVGLSRNATNNARLRSETLRYNDVIPVNVVDSYANLAYFSLGILKWVSTECQFVKYVVKSDDDTFVNVTNLMFDLKRMVHRHFIMGYVIAGARPMRNVREKWFTPPSKYRASTYPAYVSGSAYVISGDLVSDLHRTCNQMPLFWIEDVFITGLCAKKANATLIHNAKFKIDIDTQGSGKGKRLETFLTLHRIPPEEMLSFGHR